MPTSPPSRCTIPSCASYATKKGKCDEHYVPWETPSKRAERYAAHDLAKWAAEVLERDPMCRKCGRAKSQEADHIIPISRGGAGLDLGNGQGLCKRCHWWKTRQEIGENNSRRAGKTPQSRSRQL